MEEVFKKFEIEHATTSPYHPMSNGLVEAYNGTLKTMLKRMCMEEPKKWNKFLDPILFAYREVPHEATGFSPFELLYGRHIRGPLIMVREQITCENEEQKRIEAKNCEIIEAENRRKEEQIQAKLAKEKR